MALIQLSNLTFSYEGAHTPVFEDLTLSLDTSWRLGLVGRNGRGKTTLLKLLCKTLVGSGSVNAPGHFMYFPHEPQNRNLCAREVAREACPDCEDWQLLREINLLALSPDVLDRPFRTLSNGERTKLLLATLFLQEDNFPLIDEPTNHLDSHGREVVGRYLRSKPGFILVSHDRAFLDGCIDHILAFEKTGPELQIGNFSSWWLNKQQKDAYELAENNRLKKEVRRLSGAARRTTGWSDAVEKTKYQSRNAGLRPDRGFIGHKSAKMMKRAKSIEARRLQAAEEKSTLLRNLEEAQPLKLSPLPFSGGPLATLKDVCIQYGNVTVCQGIDLTVFSGDRIALRGNNGSGKSSLLKLLAGEPLSHTGDVQRSQRAQISCVEQDASQLLGGLSDYAAQRQIDRTLFYSILRKLDFPRRQFEQDLSTYSAGQKKKVLLAASLCTPAHLYLWDEPLNYVDVFSRMQLEELLLEFHPTIVFVEHDDLFCRSVATKTLSL